MKPDDKQMQILPCLCGKPNTVDDIGDNKPKYGVHCTDNLCPIEWDRCYGTEEAAIEDYNKFVNALNTRPAPVSEELIAEIEQELAIGSKVDEISLDWMIEQHQHHSDIKSRWICQLAEFILDKAEALQQPVATPYTRDGEIYENFYHKVTGWGHSYNDSRLGTEVFVFPKEILKETQKELNELIEKATPADKSNQELVEALRLKSTDARLADERNEELLELLVWAMQWFGGSNIDDNGVVHLSSDHYEQTREYGCLGCNAKYTSKYPRWELDFQHERNCKYVRAKQLTGDKKCQNAD